MRTKLWILHQSEENIVSIHKKQGGTHQKAEAMQENLGCISLSCTEE